MAEITGMSGPVTKIDVLGGVPGAAGVSVTTAELDADGHLLIGKSNGVTLDVGKVKFDVTPEVQAAWDGAVAAETEATTQAGIATSAASNAKSSEDKAAASAAAASGAAASEAAAKTSETNAALSASSAATSATTATTKAGVATSAATAAATSASNAALSESAAATSESIATTAASNAATSESNAASSESHAASSASAAAGSANAANSSATAASGSANAAALSATAASGSATAAATSAGQFNTWFLRGKGSPVGVITPASAGVQYVDLQATCGARVWISTGTTASAWKVVEGDTGKRLLASVVPLQQGRFCIQRVNGTVLLYVEDVRVFSEQASADTRVLNIPQYFDVTQKFFSGFSLTNPYFWRGDILREEGVGQYLSMGAESTNRAYCRDTCVLKASSPYWPSTLPGIPF